MAQISQQSVGNFDPLRSDRPLIVYVDIKSSRAFVSREPTLAVARRLGGERQRDGGEDVEVNWLPRIVAPIERSPAASADDSRGARHSRIRAEDAAKGIVRQAEVQGLILEDLYRPTGGRTRTAVGAPFRPSGCRGLPAGGIQRLPAGSVGHRGPCCIEGAARGL